MRERKTTELDFFAGGVPAGAILQMVLGEISEMLERHSDSSKKIAELSFIGAVSQFEAFWKDSFASLINISPSLLKNLRAAGIDVRLDPEAAIELGDDFWHSLGFLIAERLDFGSAQKINATYSTLLKVTPFGKSEKKEYDRVLADRNLLVHHGGIYTNSYIKQTLGGKDYPNRPHKDSLAIDKSFVIEKITFFETVAPKFLVRSSEAMDTLIQARTLAVDKVGLNALNIYAWWDE